MTRCAPGCVCGRHSGWQRRRCRSGCQCGRHFKSWEHRRRIAEGVRNAHRKKEMADG